MVDELQAVRKKLFDAETAGLQAGGLHETPHIQWFHVQDRFFPMGVKMIGAFCDAIKGTDLVDPDKYIAGFQIVPDEVPGFGPIPLHQAKISMRVSPSMEGEIRAGRAPPRSDAAPRRLLGCLPQPHRRHDDSHRQRRAADC